MARYKVILTYDGTEFLGFQRQAKARTVQGVVEEALREVGWQGKAILAAGRTDTGVHARGQVIAFDLEWEHSDFALQRALNASLPPDIAARATFRADDDFHPRYAALARHYQYCLLCDEVRQPLRERYAWRVWPPAELERLQEAATYIAGTHDFAAFGTPPRAGGSTVRTIFEASWFQDGSWLYFDIIGNAFLYRMVRRLVNFQVEIGQGLHQPEEMGSPLSEGQSTPIQGLAPANGLTLVEVIYPPKQD